MPLRCIDEHQNGIHAFDVSEEAWHSLAERNKRERHLRMPCCAAEVALKRSKLGTRFFAHKAVGNCVTAPETEHHLRLKQLAVEVARSQGWDAETEISGLTPSGELWRADVLAIKGNAKIAVEIQWSNETVDETLRRQERYRLSGVRGLWLCKRRGAPVTSDLPCAEISGDGVHNFTAKLSSGQTLPVGSFLEAAFAARLKFNVPQGTAGTVSVRVAPTKCWHNACGADSSVLIGVDVAFGPHRREFNVAAFSEHDELLETVLNSLPKGLPIGTIKTRFSKTMGTAYLSNGCVRCDRLFGAHFEHELWYDAEAVSSFPIRASGPWFDLFQNGDRQSGGWGVFRADELPV